MKIQVKVGNITNITYDVCKKAPFRCRTTSLFPYLPFFHFLFLSLSFALTFPLRAMILRLQSFLPSFTFHIPLSASLMLSPRRKRQCGWRAQSYGFLRHSATKCNHTLLSITSLTVMWQ